MHRFLIPQTVPAGESILLPQVAAEQIHKVLRLQEGNRILLTDGKGDEYIAELTEVTKKRVNAKAIEKFERVAEKIPEVTIGQGIPKGTKMDLIIQKGTELGATRFVPLSMERSVVRLDEQGCKRKRDRWNRIAAEAFEQSGRLLLPEVAAPRSLSRFCVEACNADMKILFWEGEKEKGLQELLSQTSFPKKISLIIGPEGGVTEEEVATANKAGFCSVGLGGNTLRTETVALATLSIILFFYGGLGGTYGED